MMSAGSSVQGRVGGTQMAGTSLGGQNEFYDTASQERACVNFLVFESQRFSF